MLRYLLLRPIAVSVILIAALAISLLVFFQLPVSLLPAIDVPEITIAVRYPNGSPEEIEQNILKPIRESMLTLNGIKTSESLAQNEVFWFALAVGTIGGLVVSVAVSFAVLPVLVFSLKIKNGINNRIIFFRKYFLLNTEVRKKCSEFCLEIFLIII